MSTTHPIITKRSFIATTMGNTWLDFGKVLLETSISANFILKIWGCYLKVEHYFGHISEMVGQIDVKRKGKTLVW